MPRARQSSSQLLHGPQGRHWPVRRLLYRRHAVLAVALVLGPLLATITFLHDVRQARLGVADAFRQDAARVFGTLREEVKECVTATASAADLLRTFGPVDRERFGEFARSHLARTPTLLAVLWAPDLPGEHFPVEYRESLQGVEIHPAIGQDLAAVPASLDALRRARDTGEAAMTSALPGTLGKSLHLYWAVYRRGMPPGSVAERREALRGFVGAVFRLDAVMAYCLRQSGGLSISLADQDASAEDRILSYPASPGPDPPGSWLRPRQLADLIRSPLGWQKDLEVAGRHWRLTLAPTSAYVYTKLPNALWEDAFATLVATSLVSAYLLLLIRRNADVERLVASRTNELNLAHDRLLADEATVRQLTHKVLSVQEEERRRLSRELHDEAGQSLTALALHLRLLQDDLKQAQAQVKSRVREAETLALGALETIRMAARHLRPPDLERLGITASLRSLCEDVGRWANLPIGFTGGEIPPLPTTTAVCLYRSLQEALTNAAKYAGATRVSVTLEDNGDSVVLSVEDDGRGFDTGSVSLGGRPQGVGLIGMRERLELVGGTMAIASRPGHGTRLVAQVPRAPATPGEAEHAAEGSPWRPRAPRLRSSPPLRNDRARFRA